MHICCLNDQSISTPTTAILVSRHDRPPSSLNLNDVIYIPLLETSEYLPQWNGIYKDTFYEIQDQQRISFLLQKLQLHGGHAKNTFCKKRSCRLTINNCKLKGKFRCHAIVYKHDDIGDLKVFTFSWCNFHLVRWIALARPNSSLTCQSFFLK